MLALGLGYAFCSGICNGLFTAPLKMIPRWKWENIWLVFIVTSCLVGPFVIVSATVPNFPKLFSEAPAGAVVAALLFGFAWGFGAILFGRSVERLGVSVANTLVIGISSALGSLVPLILGGKFSVERRQTLLFLGVSAFVAGVWTCGAASRRRESSNGPARGGQWAGYLFAVGAGIMSAVFNIGYSLALPIASAGERLGLSHFRSTNCIWMLMLAAGSIPNIVYCAVLSGRNRSLSLFFSDRPAKAWIGSIVMGCLWGGSIMLYGAAVPLLGDIGPSIGWPLSLAVGLLTANGVGLALGEWRRAAPATIRLMQAGIAVLLGAVVLCALSAKASS